MKAILTAATVMFATASASAQSPAPAGASKAERMALYEEARKHRVDGDFASCYEKTKRAAAVEQTPGVTSLLGDCAVSAGKPAEGAYYLSLALKMKLSAAIRENSKKQLAVARKQIAVVTIALDPADAAPAIDGAPVELVDGAAFLLPGTHVLRAERPGHEPAEASVSLVAGEERTVTLTLVPIDKPPPGPVPQPNGDGDSGVHVAWPIATGVLAAGAIAAGAAFAVIATRRAGDARDIGASLDAGAPANTACSAGSRASFSAGCDELDDAIGEHDTMSDAAIAMFAVGGALVVTSVALGIASADEHDASTEDGARVLILPAASPLGGGALIQGSF